MRSPTGFVGGFLTVFGIAFLVPGLWVARDYARIVQTWPEAEAEGAGGSVSRYTGKKNRTSYRVQYKLRYRVEGREYVIPFISNTSYGSRKRAEQRAAQYREGTKHRVRYDPQARYDARENAGWNLSFFVLPLIFTGVGLLLFAIGLAVWIWGWRQGRGPLCPACGTPVASHFRFCPQCGTRRTDARPENPEEEEWEPHERAAAERERVERETLMVRKNRTGNRIGGLVFGGIGLAALIAAAVMAVRRHQIVHSWPEAEGTVTRSEVEGGRNFRPRIELRYTVGGREFHGPASYEWSNNYAWVRREVEGNPVGSRRTVRYNPADPRDLHLNAGYTVEFFVLPGILGLLGIIFGPLGAVLLYQGFVWKARFCDACRRAVRKEWRSCPFCGSLTPNT
jgi:RNA polymerase subunit RPABC4/transcription elongation factor Spt4